MRVDLSMALRIMLLDVLKLRRLLESWDIPVQVPHPLVQVRVSRADIADVGLEMLNVYDVKADQGGEETDVGFGDGR